MERIEELDKEIALLEQEQNKMFNIIQSKRGERESLSIVEHKSLVGRFFIHKPKNGEVFWIEIYKILSMQSDKICNVEQKFFEDTGFVEQRETSFMRSYFNNKEEISEELYNNISKIIKESDELRETYTNKVGSNHAAIVLLYAMRDKE